MKTAFNNHNQAALSPKEEEYNRKKCNCNIKEEFPLKESCLSNSIIRKAYIALNLQDYMVENTLVAASQLLNKIFINPKK